MYSDGDPGPSTRLNRHDWATLSPVSSVGQSVEEARGVDGVVGSEPFSSGII